MASCKGKVIKEESGGHHLTLVNDACLVLDNLLDKYKGKWVKVTVEVVKKT